MWNSRKIKEIETEKVKLQVYVDNLQNENQFLRDQVSKLQEALMAKESPYAYRQMKMDEAAVEAESEGKFELKEQLEKLHEENYFAKEYAAQIEAPFFKDPDDLIAKMSRIIGVNLPSSHHGNDES